MYAVVPSAPGFLLVVSQSQMDASVIGRSYTIIPFFEVKAIKIGHFSCKLWVICHVW
jgi:hypothetical protein